MHTDKNVIYPDFFPIKIIGKNYPGFADEILSILNSSKISIDHSCSKFITSKSGKYISFNLNIKIDSRDHFSNIYSLLYSHHGVSFVI